jgi:CrcB protein
MAKLLLLATGSLVGGFARYFMAGFVYRILGASFPYGTLAVNIAGCFLVGLLASLADKKFLIGPDMRLLLMVGFCGAFTTFSTFMLETAYLLRDGEVWQAFLNIVLSVTLGFFILRLGMLLGELF